MNSPPYLELTVESTQHHASALSDILLELGALSVTLEDAQANTQQETPLFDEPGIPAHPGPQAEVSAVWPQSRMIILTSAAQDPVSLLAAAAHAAGLPGIPSYHIRPLTDQNWVEIAQNQCQPLSFGKKIWIVPSWHPIPETVPDDAHLLRLDPGLAFGTGHHATTRCCMMWLEEHVCDPHKVLDYGCGSGILAILAKKCGAQHVVGVDIDPQALEIAYYNSQYNQSQIEYFCPDQCPKLEFDIVVANILFEPLKSIASILHQRISIGGWLVLSGILAEQTDQIIEAYMPWLCLSIYQIDEGWACLAGRRTH